MPIYEYRCQDCGHEFEKIQKLSEGSLNICPECHEPALIKLVSASGFRLKGTGWYETDFKNNSSQLNGKPKADVGSNREDKRETTKLSKKKSTSSNEEL